ncbi:MAG: hypothetical protein AB1775_12945 [Bacteroidota bacterium]
MTNGLSQIIFAATKNKTMKNFVLNISAKEIAMGMMAMMMMPFNTKGDAL